MNNEGNRIKYSVIHKMPECALELRYKETLVIVDGVVCSVFLGVITPLWI